MSKFRRRVAVAGAAALALAASVGASGASALVDDVKPSYVTSWLALQTGSTNAVSLVNGDKTVGTIQQLTPGRACGMDQGDKNLLEFTATGLGPGLSGGAIGAREKKNSSGTSCSAVDYATLESLTLKVKTPGLVAASASLDIDLKQSARILATATRTGDTTPHYFELQSGLSIGLPPKEPTATIFECNNPADSGPDAGAKNNCRWEISAPSWTRVSLDSDVPPLVEDGIVFDSLKLEALTGSFSLMGGADGPVDDPAFPLPSYLGLDSDPQTNDVSITSASIFEMVEGTVDCGETVPLRGRSGDAVDSSTWERWVNFGETQSECDAYAYSSNTGTENGRAFAEFVKPLDFQANAQAIWVTTISVSGAVPTPTMDLDGDEVGAEELQPCADDWYDSVTGVFTGPLTEPTGPYACLVSLDKPKGGGSIKSVTYTVYVYGDAKLRF